MDYKDEIIEGMQNNAITNGYNTLEDAIRQLLNAGIPESAILLSVRVIYHDIIDELNDEVEN